jgi:hypothetical protein
LKKNNDGSAFRPVSRFYRHHIIEPIRNLLCRIRSFKEEDDRQKPYLVLDWPRGWRGENPSEVVPAISALDVDPDHHDYYSNTLAFVRYSEKHQDWYKHLGVLPRKN